MRARMSGTFNAAANFSSIVFSVPRGENHFIAIGKMSNSHNYAKTPGGIVRPGVISDTLPLDKFRCPAFGLDGLLRVLAELVGAHGQSLGQLAVTQYLYAITHLFYHPVFE